MSEQNLTWKEMHESAVESLVHVQAELAATKQKLEALEAERNELEKQEPTAYLFTGKRRGLRKVFASVDDNINQTWPTDGENAGIEWKVDNLYTRPLPAQTFQPYKAEKIGGSFQHHGTVVAEFTTTAGEKRIVLEFAEPVNGMLHVYRPDQVEAI